MFRDVTFPDDVGRALNVGRTWPTKIIAGELSGKEERMAKRSQSYITIECDYIAHDDDSKKAIVDFLEVVEGPLYSFRVRNWLDFEAGYEYTSSGWSVTTPMQFATGDAATTDFQLRRKYSSGAFDAYRKVTKPRSSIDAPTKIYLDSVEQTSGYTVDYATGIVTFSVAPGDGVEIAWAGLYDLCCRVADETTSFQSANRFVQRANSIKLMEVDE